MPLLFYLTSADSLGRLVDIVIYSLFVQDFLSGSVGEESACNAGDVGSIPGLGKSPGEENGHASSFAWRIPCTEEPGGLQSMRLQRVGHD